MATASVGANVLGTIAKTGLDFASNYIGQAVNWNWNKKAMNYAHKLNEESARKNRDFQYRMWNLENSYNTPSAQRQRLEEAGYNPYMQNISAGNAESSPQGNMASSVTNPSLNADYSHTFDSFGDFLNNRLQQASQKELQDRQFDHDLQIQNNQFDFDRPLSNANTKIAESNARWQNYLNEANYNKTESEAQNNDYQRFMNRMEMEFNFKRRMENYDLVNAYQKSLNALSSLEQQKQQFMVDNLGTSFWTSIGLQLAQGRLADATARMNDATADNNRLEYKKNWEVFDSAVDAMKAENTYNYYKFGADDKASWYGMQQGASDYFDNWNRAKWSDQKHRTEAYGSGILGTGLTLDRLGHDWLAPSDNNRPDWLKRLDKKFAPAYYFK